MKHVRDPADDNNGLVDYRRETANNPAALLLWVHGQFLVVKTPASIMPRCWRKIEARCFRKAVAAAAPNAPPSIRLFRKAAPQQRRSATSISGWAISASSASGVSGPRHGSSRNCYGRGRGSQ